MRTVVKSFRILHSIQIAQYLGCDVEVNIPGQKIFTAQLQQVELSGHCIVGSLAMTRTCDASRIKPILRKLDSLTIKELEICHKDEWTTVEDLKVWNAWIKNSVLYMQPGMMFQLIQWHFDVYGWIDSGLALDKENETL